MHKSLALSITALFLLAPALRADDKEKPADDKDSFEAIIKDMMKTMKSATKLMTDATDKSSADKVKPELQKVGESMQKLNERIGKLGQPTKEQEAELEKKFKTEMEDAVKAMQTQIQRLQKEPYGKDLLEAVKPKKPAPPKDPTKDPAKDK